MKTTIPQIERRLLIVALLCVIAAGCSPKPPAHGTKIELTPIVDAHGNRPASEAWVASTEASLAARFKTAGVQPFFQVVATNKLQVIFRPRSAEELAAVKSMLTRPGRLAFRLVHPRSDELLSKGESAPGHELLTHTEHRPDGPESKDQVLAQVAEKPEADAFAVTRAMATRSPMGEPEIMFELTRDATEAFAKLTRENIGRRLAIVVDGKLYSAPRIMGAIPGGRGQISGRFTAKEAAELAAVLQSILPVPLEIVTETNF